MRALDFLKRYTGSCCLVQCSQELLGHNDGLFGGEWQGGLFLP